MPTDTLYLYGIANCDTMKKTRRWLDEHGLHYQFHDYKKAGLPLELAQTMVAALPMETLLNKRGSTWRKLSAQEQASIEHGGTAALISAHPSVVRRPLLWHPTLGWMAGYDESRWQALQSLPA